MSIETKAEKFERVGAPRIANATKALQLLQNLGRSEYEATPERKREIIRGLELELAELEQSWKLDVRAVDAAPSAPPALAEPATREERMTERQEIRAAANQMYDGDVKGGMAKLRKIILGWPV